MQGLEKTVAQERWVFEHTVEGLFRGPLKGRLSSPALAALRQAGIDLSRPLLPAYSSDTWARALHIAAADLTGTQPPEAAWRRLGQDYILGLSQTLMGRAMVNVATLLGPLRFLRRLNPTLRGADNYLESRLQEVGPGACEVFLNEVMEQPAYYRGVLEALVALAGGREGRARMLTREGPGAWFLVEWEDTEGR